MPPLVSIVTPSYNMGRYLERTIASVLSQDYPQIEYVVMDAGSTDQTLSILSRVGQVCNLRADLQSAHFHYTSQPDAGAADAIRQAFQATQGEIIAWLNADDIYLPGAVSAAVEAFAQNPDAAVVYGRAVWIDEADRPIGDYPTRDFDAAQLASECYICQPAAFIRREAYQSAGGIDPSLQFTFDYDLWLRMARRHRFVFLPRVLAQSRMHAANKTLGSRRRVLRETIRTVRANAGEVGFGHIYAYACHLADRRDQFFEPLRPSWYKYVLALFLGLAINRSASARFLREYFAVLPGSLRGAPTSDASSQ